MNNQLLDAFKCSNLKDVKQQLSNGADRKIIFDYVNNINSKDLTIMQGWILEELNNVKDHGFSLNG